ncbi:hypothetical protein niasHT_015655 [Heterodera trifolii]|uniref:DRBM domain-containing protein n=1 Tax=Heterodera trifolii TaxID=157864 RepID=A0ABD2L556_9BILA
MSSDGDFCNYDRTQYFQSIIDSLSQKGLLEANRQSPISQSTLSFLMDRKKDPMSMVNIYCSASGEPNFEFFGFHLAVRPSKFLFITELRGRPVYGFCAASKKEAKKACALRLLDILMTEERLECVNVSGRKVRKMPPKPIPTKTANVEQSQQQENMHLSFSDDIDLDAIRKDFERLNPLPSAANESEVFARLRSTAFRLHTQNAFWCQFDPSEETKAKMEQCRMGNNPMAFVKRCIVLQELKKSTEAMEQNNEQMPSQIQLDFHVFTLPYVLPHYACLSLFDGEIHHGAIATSKQRAKISCAAVLCELLVKMGWADVKRAKKRKNADGEKALKKKKRKGENGQMEDAAEEGNVRLSHQFLLTLHPNESLDPRTHFFLASSAKSPIQLLKEVADRESFEVSYTKGMDEDFNKYIVHVNTIEGTAEGRSEVSLGEAKCSAARKGIDALVKSGRIAVQSEEFVRFKETVARCLNI